MERNQLGYLKLECPFLAHFRRRRVLSLTTALDQEAEVFFLAEPKSRSKVSVVR